MAWSFRFYSKNTVFSNFLTYTVNTFQSFPFFPRFFSSISLVALLVIILVIVERRWESFFWKKEIRGKLLRRGTKIDENRKMVWTGKVWLGYGKGSKNQWAEIVVIWWESEVRPRLWDDLAQFYAARLRWDRWEARAEMWLGVKGLTKRVGDTVQEGNAKSSEGFPLIFWNYFFWLNFEGLVENRTFFEKKQNIFNIWFKTARLVTTILSKTEKSENYKHKWEQWDQ